MNALIRGINGIFKTFAVLFVLAVAGFLGFLVFVLVSAGHFILMGLAILTGIAYCVWEMWDTPKKPPQAGD